jgi:hypothetical protein
MVSFTLHYKLLGFFLLLVMVHKLIIVIPKSRDVLFATIFQLMLMLIMFPMGRIRALWAITKTMGHFLWKNMYLMNIWKRVEGETCCHKKFKEMEINKKQQNNNNILSSLINDFFGNHWSYNKIDFTKHTFFWRFGLIHYHSWSKHMVLRLCLCVVFSSQH